MPKVTIRDKEVTVKEALRMFREAVEQATPEVVLDELLKELKQKVSECENSIFAEAEGRDIDDFVASENKVFALRWEMLPKSRAIPEGF